MEITQGAKATDKRLGEKKALERHTERRHGKNDTL